MTRTGKREKRRNVRGRVHGKLHALHLPFNDGTKAGKRAYNKAYWAKVTRKRLYGK